MQNLFIKIDVIDSQSHDLSQAAASLTKDGEQQRDTRKAIHGLLITVTKLLLRERASFGCVQPLTNYGHL